MNQIVYFRVNGKVPFLDWVEELDNSFRARIFKVLTHMQQGNLGDTKLLAPHLYETRLFFGSGYRIYYTIQGGQIIIILCGGNKKTQTKDIALAKKYLTLIQGGDYEQKK